MLYRISESAGTHFSLAIRSQESLGNAVLEFSKAKIERMLILNPTMVINSGDSYDASFEEKQDSSGSEYDYGENKDRSESISMSTMSETVNPFFRAQKGNNTISGDFERTIQSKKGKE